MLDPTVTTTPDTGEPQTARADELKPSDWIRGGDLVGFPVEVLSAHAYKDDDQIAKVCLVVRIDGIPEISRHNAWRLFRLATDVELEKAKEEARRYHVADQLRRLGEVILEHELPLPRYAVSISFGSVDPEVAATIADAMGSKLERVYDSSYEVAWPPNHKSYEQGVHATWTTKMPEAAPVETADEAEDPDHGRTTAVAEAKPDTLGVALGRATVPDAAAQAEIRAADELETAALVGEPQCPPECRQNWTRASDPLVHVAHCPVFLAGKPHCLPGCYEPTLDVDHVDGCPVAAAQQSNGGE